jgi:hypothetical protein
MHTTEDLTQPDPMNGPIWLELIWDGGSRLFELEASSERSIVIGSMPGAQVRIEKPGVSPVHLHFERERDRVVVIPAYQADLRVNAARVGEPCPLQERALIEFCDLVVEVVIHRERPVRPSDDPEPTLIDKPSAAIDRAAALPHEGDPTHVALPAVAGRRESLVSLTTTVEIPRSALPAEALGAQKTEPIPRGTVGPTLGPQKTEAIRPVALAPLGPQGTVILSRSELVADAAGERHAAPATVRSPTEAPRVTMHATVAVLKAPFAEAPVDVAPTRFDLPSHQSSPPPPAASSKGPGQEIGMETAAFDVSKVAMPTPTPSEGAGFSLRPNAAQGLEALAGASLNNEPEPSTRLRSMAPVARESRPRARGPASWLALLGGLATRRPLPVAAAALVSAATLSLALLGVTRLTGAPVPSERSRAAVAAQGETPNRELVPLAAPSSGTPVTIPHVTPAPSATVVKETPTDTAARRKGEPHDPELGHAIGHVAAGRYAEAEQAYAALAARSPSTPAYAALARLLAKRASAACATNATKPSCPEIQR